jgi:membrane protease YdiL (CAAX protease family)
VTDNHIINIRESVRLISIIALSLLGVCLQNSQLTVLSAWWAFVLLILGNVRRLSHVRKATYFIRMTLYFFPYALPVFFAGKSFFSINIKMLYSCAAIILFFALWILFRQKSLKLLLSKQLIAESTKESRFVIILRIYNLIGAAICEELFFRQYILTIDSNILILGAVSIVYFVLSHWLLPWGQRFAKNDLINQAAFGGMNVLIFIYSGSIIPCVVLHMLMNSINIIRLIKIYDRHYIRKEKFDKLIHSDVYSELDL